jgi:hypothetical protein
MYLLHLDHWNMHLYIRTRSTQRCIKNENTEGSSSSLQVIVNPILGLMYVRRQETWLWLCVCSTGIGSEILYYCLLGLLLMGTVDHYHWTLVSFAFYGTIIGELAKRNNTQRV